MVRSLGPLIPQAIPRRTPCCGWSDCRVRLDLPGRQDHRVHQDRRGPQDLLGRRVRRDRKVPLDLPGHRVRQDQRGKPDPRGKRGLPDPTDYQDRRGPQDLLGRRVQRDRKVPLDLPGHRVQQDRRGKADPRASGGCRTHRTTRTPRPTRPGRSWPGDRIVVAPRPGLGTAAGIHPAWQYPPAPRPCRRFRPATPGKPIPQELRKRGDGQASPARYLRGRLPLKGPVPARHLQPYFVRGKPRNFWRTGALKLPLRSRGLPSPSSAQSSSQAPIPGRQSCHVSS
jgi:hypothetical protein